MTTTPDSGRSLVELVKDLPRLIVNIAKAELAQLKAEYTAKAKYAAIGIAMFVVAAVFLYFMLGVLIVAAVLAIATALPGWAAALIVAAGLLILAVILGIIGLVSLRRIRGVKPETTIASVKNDAEAVKGMGRYGK